MKKLIFTVISVLICFSIAAESDYYADWQKENYFELKQPKKRFAQSPWFNDKLDANDVFLNDCIKSNTIKSWYDAGDAAYDRKDFQTAYDYYHRSAFAISATYEVLVDYTARGTKTGTNGLTLDTDGKIKEFYYSLYNMACCKSLLGDFEEARNCLFYSFLAGYPFLDYVLKDADMKPYFQSNPKNKEEATLWYNEGNMKSSLYGKKIIPFCMNDCTPIEFYSNGRCKLTNQDSYGWVELSGTYFVRNYQIFIHYDTFYQYPLIKGPGPDGSSEFGSEPSIKKVDNSEKYMMWGAEYPHGFYSQGFYSALK